MHSCRFMMVRRKALRIVQCSQPDLIDGGKALGSLPARTASAIARAAHLAVTIGKPWAAKNLPAPPTLYHGS